MFDFGALPPEINSARMYAGPGSGPMMAAASAWDAVAAQLDLFGAGYSSVVSGLQGESWSGGAALAMAAAAAPYVEWATTTAARAEQAANQARAAAAAYEAAFAATVPPAVVSANRALLAMLVATNFLGQNAPAIAATEAAYAEMWAQDAAAMYGYATSASAAAALTPFSQPPQTTTPAGQAAQGAAVDQAGGASAGQSQSTLSQLMAALPQQLQTLASGGSTNASAADSSATSASTPLLSAVADFNTVTGPLIPAYELTYTTFTAGILGTGLFRAGVQAKDLPALASPGIPITVGAQTPQAVGDPVLANMGRAAPIGGMSVPQSWTAAAPAPGLAAEPLASAETGFRALPAWAANPPTNGSGGVPALGPMRNLAERRTGNAVFRMRDRRFRMPRPAVGG